MDGDDARSAPRGTVRALTAAQHTQLVEEGYLVLKHLLPRAEVERVNARLDALWEAEGAAAGGENTYVEPNVRRLANLVDKGDVFRPLFVQPLVLEAAKVALGPEINLAMLNARDVLPGTDNIRQPFHCDTDPNQNGGKPDAIGYLTCTAIWLLTESTAENGATRLLPGTHRTGKLPEEVLRDVHAAQAAERIVTGDPGDVLVVNGHTWHCGGANQTPAGRRSLLAHYVRPDVPRDPHRRQRLSPETRARMSPQELRLLGPEG
jgi:ectoine hydroxylase-related dioxygenase (phytanoyl-CoA dioxygenase family)